MRQAPLRDENGRCTHRLKRDVAPNLSGRRPGSRVRYTEAFFKDLLADWQRHGKKSIALFREEAPHVYVKLAAALMRKHRR